MQRSGVAVSVLHGVEGHRPPAGAATVLTVRCLVALLRDDRLDPASTQVGAVGPGGVGLIGGHRAGPGAWTPDRATHLDLLQYWHEPGAVSGLATGEHERQRAAANIRGQVNLARQPTTRPPKIGSRQAGTMPTPHLPAIGPRLLLDSQWSGLAGIDRPFSTAAASVNAASTAGSTLIPAAS